MAKNKKLKSIQEKDHNKKELLKSIVEALINKQASPIIDLLSSKKPVNEFNIAEKLGLTINQTRNILYKLSDLGLVSFTRKKDKRKGWYIYFWILNAHKSLILLEDKLKKKLEEIDTQIKERLIGRYYYCKTCSIEVDEETALLNNFTCTECADVYEQIENDQIIKELEKKIIKLKKELNLVSEEVQKYKDQAENYKKRKIKKEEVEKDKKKKIARRKAKKTLKDKREKLMVKKTIKNLKTSQKKRL